MSRQPKSVVFRGSALDDLRAFPQDARRTAGYQIDRVQSGRDPDDWKPMPSIGTGVREIRIRESGGAFRVIFVAKFPEAVFILHCFARHLRRQRLPTSRWRSTDTLTSFGSCKYDGQNLRQRLGRN